MQKGEDELQEECASLLETDVMIQGIQPRLAQRSAACHPRALAPLPVLLAQLQLPRFLQLVLLLSGSASETHLLLSACSRYFVLVWSDPLSLCRLGLCLCLCLSHPVGVSHLPLRYFLLVDSEEKGQLRPQYAEDPV